MINEDSFEEHNLIDFLKSRNLYHVVTQYEAFIPGIIREFYAHLFENFGREGASKQQCV